MSAAAFGLPVGRPMLATARLLRPALASAARRRPAGGWAATMSGAGDAPSV